MQAVRRFAEVLHPRPAPSGIDIACGLRHFAIITYAFDPARFAGVMPPRFRLDTVEIAGRERALLSVVPFPDLISPDPQPRVAGFAPPAAQHGAT